MWGSEKTTKNVINHFYTIWFSGVPQGSILVSSIQYVFVGKAFLLKIAARHAYNVVS